MLLVYSIDKYDTFEQLGSWMREIQENSHKETLIWVVGAKLDLEDIRKVPKKKAEEYSKSIDAVGFSEVSSKTG
ncbi:MAG: hypothetical protein E6Q33_01495 [Neisseriales bacterium]|nr:MAG: hypothetical protein E6Q33_01495 [Neisseriales bacterium]